MNIVTTPLPKNVLFTHYGDNWIRGSERCLLDLIKHLDKKLYKPILWCNQPAMANAAKELGVEVHCDDFPLLFGWQAPRFDFISFTALIAQATKLIKEHNIALIHANSAAPCQWLTFAAKRCQVPLICHLHSIYQLRDRLTLGLYQTNMVVGVSDYVVAPLVYDQKPMHQIKVISNGIDTQRLLAQPVTNLRQTLGINPGDFVIATLGSLIKRKGVDLIIEALAKLLNKEIETHLLVIGAGPELANLKDQSVKLGIDKHISFLGECDNAVGILRGNADLFVSGAREEAFGLVFAEASLAGLAIVAPDIGGISDIVINNKSGLLIPPEDVNALVKAIQNLYLQPHLCIEMAKVGQAHVMSHYTIEHNALQFQNLYQQQLSTPLPKQTLSKKLSSLFALLSTFSNALKNRKQRTIKGGFVHER